MLPSQLDSIHEITFRVRRSSIGTLTLQRSEFEDRKRVVLPSRMAEDLAVQIGREWLVNEGCPARVADVLIREAMTSGEWVCAGMTWSTKLFTL